MYKIGNCTNFQMSKKAQAQNQQDRAHCNSDSDVQPFLYGPFRCIGHMMGQEASSGEQIHGLKKERVWILSHDAHARDIYQCRVSLITRSSI